MAEEILGKAFATGGVVGGDGFLAATIDVKAAVFPGEEVGEPFGAEVFAVAAVTICQSGEARGRRGW